MQTVLALASPDNSVTFSMPIAIVATLLSIFGGAMISALTAVILWARKQDKRSDDHEARIADMEEDRSKELLERAEIKASLNKLHSDVAVTKNDVSWIRDKLGGGAPPRNRS